MTAVDAFCADHFTMVGMSEKRRRLVRATLERLETHAGVPLELIDHNHFRAFINAELDRGLHVNTVRKHANCCRPFFTWAWRNGHIDGDRYMRLKDVPNPAGSTNQGLPRPYKRADLDRFWADLDKQWPLDDGKYLRRWHQGRSRYPRVWPHAMHLQVTAVTHLALHLGMRKAEIEQVDIDEIHPDNAFVVVRGVKGQAGAARLREVPHTPGAREAVGQWLEMRTYVMRHFDVDHDRPWLGLHPTATMNSLIPSSPAAPANSKRMDGLLRTFGAWEYHRLRHTCGTEWLRSGMPIEQVQRLLGHARLQQTLGYAEIVRDDLQRAVERRASDFERRVGRAA